MIKNINLTVSTSARFLFVFILLNVFAISAFASKKAKQTNIILINAEAVLVELDANGDILKQYIKVPDYFTSRRSHESLVQRSINKVKGLSVHKSFDKNHFLSEQKSNKDFHVIDMELLMGDKLIYSGQDSYLNNFHYGNYSLSLTAKKEDQEIYLIRDNNFQSKQYFPQSKGASKYAPRLPNSTKSS